MSAVLRATCRNTIGLLLAAIPAIAAAQDRRDEQFYYPGSFNWSFLGIYPEAARLFNAFDYGHAVLYERLLTRPDAAVEALDKEFQFLTTDLLIRPPRFAVAEEVIEPTYAKLAWQAKQMFDWAHVLHRQIYDVYADERLGDTERDALIERLTDYYLSRKDYAFAAAPKSMALMDEQYFSQVFRKRHPKFNGLIWAYHWLQVGLYEPLIQGKTPAEKKSGIKATLARFWSMLENPPAGFPMMMPMTSAIAPMFSAKHPRAAVIFDNLHMMHDVISDILAADTIPRDRKRAVIYEQLAEFRDGSRNTMTMDEWRNMAEAMGGIGMMGGPATGLLVMAPMADTGMAGMRHGAKPGQPSADSAMAGMRHRATPDKPSADTAMAGMRHGAKPDKPAADTAMAGMRHGATPGKPSADTAMPGMRHEAMKHPPGDPAAHAPMAGSAKRHPEAAGPPDNMMATMMALRRRMMADPVIRRRIEADTALGRMMSEIMGRMDRMPAPHGEHMPGKSDSSPAMKPDAEHNHSASEPAKPAAHEDHAIPSPPPPASSRTETGDTGARAAADPTGAGGGGLFPMHSWHPVAVHLPLIALLLAVLFDVIAASGRRLRWRDAATLLWWVGLLGAAAAVTTGLLAYNRVDHSGPAHAGMTLHRNLALATVAVLLATAIWRWRRPFSPAASALGVLGAIGLSAVGYLGGDIVYSHAVGIPTATLERVMHERGEEDDTEPSALPVRRADDAPPSDSAVAPQSPSRPTSHPHAGTTKHKH